RTDERLPLPAVVVLNACYTADQDLTDVGQVISPLAVELIRGDNEGGVPIVMGMAGEVADQACRLFTQHFYEALLHDGDIVRAAAEGRRFGIRHGGSARTSVDWALPTLFLSEKVPEKIQFAPEVKDQEWQRKASSYATGPFPVFCDRMEFFRWY